MSIGNGLKQLYAFLNRHRWDVVSERGPFVLYSAPRALEIEPSFRLAVPSRSDLPDFNRAFESTVTLLADVYGQSPETLLTALREDSTILSVRIFDDEVGDGTISLDKFDALVRRMKGIVLNAANAVVDDDPLTAQISAVAEMYVRQCSFMQTQRGSFIARVQLPSSTVRGQPHLFEVPSVHGIEVTQRVRSALLFITDEVIAPAKLSYDDTSIDQQIEHHGDVMNVRLLKSLAKLFEETGLGRWNFSFVNEELLTMIAPERITMAKVQQTNAYIKRIEYRLKQSSLVETSGMVVQLQSKNPSRDNNMVRMEVFFGHRQVNLLVQVNRDDYTTAVRAHMSGKIVRVKGHARKMQTQQRIDYPEIFKIQE
jgi:hypothetical protein